MARFVEDEVIVAELVARADGQGVLRALPKRDVHVVPKRVHVVIDSLVWAPVFKSKAC